MPIVLFLSECDSIVGKKDEIAFCAILIASAMLLSFLFMIIVEGSVSLLIISVSNAVFRT